MISKTVSRKHALKMIAFGSLTGYSAIKRFTQKQNYTVKQTDIFKKTGLELHYPYTLPELPYSYDAVASAIDAQTMEILHSRHHQAYINNLNGALETRPELQETCGNTLTTLIIRTGGQIIFPHSVTF